MNRGGFEPQAQPSTLFSAVNSMLTSLQSLAAAACAWLDLAIRFWLAKAFLTETVVSMAMHAPMTMSFTGDVAPTINGLVASPLGAVVATLCRRCSLLVSARALWRCRFCSKPARCRVRMGRRRCICIGRFCSAGSLSGARARFRRCAAVARPRLDRNSRNRCTWARQVRSHAHPRALVSPGSEIVDRDRASCRWSDRPGLARRQHPRAAWSLAR